MEWQNGVLEDLMPNQDEAFICGICSKALKNKESLGKHKNTHTIEPSTCDVCDKKFDTKGLLQKHRKTVHNDIVYTCDSCPKRFTALKNLTAHIKSIHELKLEKCSVCEKTVRDTHLKRHETSCRKKFTNNIKQLQRVV